jgi:uncharacterized short protein YbdD (DUF466 family)
MPDGATLIRPTKRYCRPDKALAAIRLFRYLELTMFGNLGQAKKYLGQAAKMLIGIPDYDNYVEHMQTNHPDKPYMTYKNSSANASRPATAATAKAAYAAANGGKHGTDCSHPAHRFSRRR